MRDLRRRNTNVLAVDELAQAGVEVFTPMQEMLMTIGGRRRRRTVPVIQDLLFVRETKDILDKYVARDPNLQYRYQRGKSIDQPMTISDTEMHRFIRAISASRNAIFYKPGEITKSMYGKKVRIVGGPLDSLEGQLLSVKGMRKRRLIVEILNFVSASVEVDAEFITIL